MLISGGGISGLALANMLKEQKPDLAIRVLEKDESLGGRLKPDSDNQIGYGLNRVTENLRTELSGWPGLGRGLKFEALKKVSVLQGKDLTEVELVDFFSPVMAHTLGGKAAANHWPKVLSVLESGAEQNFGQVWKGGKQDPGFVVLNQLVKFVGISDLWGTYCSLVRSRVENLPVWQMKFTGAHLLVSDDRSIAESGGIALESSSRILRAEYVDKHWLIKTQSGEKVAKSLVVATPPWDAVRWLPKELWSPRLFALSAKTKPTSLVVLSCPINLRQSQSPLLEWMIVPSERAQMFLGEDGNLHFHATIDYEQSLQAPSVLKAVRRLKRAKKKILSFLELSADEELADRLTLLPAAWTSPCHAAERRWVNKLSAEDLSVETRKLVYAGDAYGNDLCSDVNLINSCENANNLLGSWLTSESQDDTKSRGRQKSKAQLREAEG